MKLENLSDAELTTIVRKVIADIREGGGHPSPTDVLKPLLNVGIKADMHVGDPRFKDGTYTPRLTLEWYAGSIVSVIQEQAWFAVNSLINCVDKFAPEITHGQAQGQNQSESD